MFVFIVVNLALHHGNKILPAIEIEACAKHDSSLLRSWQHHGAEKCVSPHFCVLILSTKDKKREGRWCRQILTTKICP